MTVLATAGHVDHGKSTLVSFLTEQETDRLAEEKNRGLTINLGYTFYEFNDEITSIVDVPGHSDFFKNTMAGFSNADAILFVIDSTQGWSEQSEQHFRALIGLSKLNIIFIFTKLDLPESNVEENKLIERISKIEDLNYTILKFNKNSTKREDLIKEIQEFLKTFSNNYSSFWVDRSFVIDGIGRVITGTAGKNFVVDNLYLYPRAENVEIRSIESVNKEYSQTSGSQRIAISLKKSNDITPKRGDLVSNDVLQISDFILFEILSEDAYKLSNNTVKLFVGTTNKLVQKFYLLNVNKKQYAIAKLNELVAIPAGEKMVLHNIDSNQFYGCEFMTPLLNKNLVKHLIRKSKDRTEYDSLFELVPFTTISQGVDDIKIGSLYTDSATLNNIHKHIRENFEKINKQGVAKYFYEIFFIKEEDLGDLFSKFEDLSIKENQIKLTQDTSDADIKILKLIYKDLGDELAVPNIDLKKYDREIVKNLFLEGKLIRVSKNILYTEEHLKTVVDIVHKLPNIFTISQFKEFSGLSRKYAIPLLEALDNKLITKKLDTEGNREKLVS